MKVRIIPSKVAGVVTAPPSKSYTHRAIIVATLADGQTRLVSPLIADDTGYTIDACRFLGAEINADGAALEIIGTGGNIRAGSDQKSVYVGNSGSTIRMVAPLAALVGTRVVLDGDARLSQRPMVDLLAALNSLGVKARSLGDNGCPPIEVSGSGLRGGEVVVSGEASSQHISGLLMVAPYAKGNVAIKVTGLFHSRPYVDVTTAVMRDFGVAVVAGGNHEFLVKSGQRYRGRAYRIEGDYSQAAYFLAAGAIGGGPVTVTNLKVNSVQGDRHLMEILVGMGCSVECGDDRVTVHREEELVGVNSDMGDYPDIVPTVAAVAAYARGRTELRNIGHLRYKESDRIGDTALELNRMGIRMEVSEDRLVVYGGEPQGAGVDSHGDHRLAMSLAVAACFAGSASMITGAEVVSKSYPGFWDDLKGLGAKVEEWS